MQTLIDQLVESIRADRKSIETIESQIVEIQAIGIEGLRESTLESLYKSISYLEKCVSDNRMCVVNLTHKFNVKKEQDGRV